MNSAWSNDFSYSYYRRLLQAIKANFQTYLFYEVPEVLMNCQGNPKLLLRHDVDLDLDKALAMAEIESELKISSYYSVMINCPFYTLNDRTSKSILQRIKKMGHEIGLHFDFNNHQNRNGYTDIASLTEEIDISARVLEDIISSKVHSISFHRPLKQFLKGPVLVSGRVNAYSAELMDWYLSDSTGNWREGEPIPMLENPRKPLLQLLIHPIWWGDKHMLPSERLQSFFDYRTKGFSNKRVKLFDDSLSRHLPIAHRESKHNRRIKW